MIKAQHLLSLYHLAASPGIEPGSGASETLILSIVLRGQTAAKVKSYFKYQVMLELDMNKQKKQLN